MLAVILSEVKDIGIRWVRSFRSAQDDKRVERRMTARTELKETLISKCLWTAGGLTTTRKTEENGEAASIILAISEGHW